MPPKSKTPAPIDRPLSRAYLRGFTGWSTAYPPGHSEPTSLRLMENVMVDRNGSLLVRPGLRYLSYTTSPDTDPLTDAVEGIAIDRPLVGTQEPFYVEGGGKALLLAVREVPVDPETVGAVGFRALLFTETTTVVHRLTDPEIGFEIPQGEATLNFTSATTHVEYLQIDNKIIALSDKGEPIRMFFVGGQKLAKRLTSVTVPRWEDTHKPVVVHPDAAWISNQTISQRRNELLNPSFEIDGYWNRSALCDYRITIGSSKTGTRRAELRSLPTRTNMQTSPLHSVATTGIGGWYPHADYGPPKLTADGSYLRIAVSSGEGTFLAYGAKLTTGVVAGQKYRVALDYGLGSHVEPITVLTFYNAAGAKIGSSTSLAMPKKAGRYTSPAVAAPAGTVSMRISIGGRNETSGSTAVTARNIVLCKDGEPTTMFHGGSGTNYFWSGTSNASAAVYHPPADIYVYSNMAALRGGSPYVGSIHATCAVAKTITVAARGFDKDRKQLQTISGSGTVGPGVWTVISAAQPSSPATAVLGDIVVSVPAVARGQIVYLDAAMIETGVAAVGTYFDGSTAPTTLTTNVWGVATKPHASVSVQTVKNAVAVVPTPETPTAKTLVASGGATANPFKVGFFYTFSTEIGESAPSKITEIRTSRPWANWLWETANVSGEPSGTATATAELCADQLVVSIPLVVYNQAIAEGAIKWNLYAMSWSDQDVVPVVASLVGEKRLYADAGATQQAAGLGYDEGGWITITPARVVSLNEMPLPTLDNRYNYSDPTRARTGLVAGDRLIVVGDPRELATIRWTSNRAGEYTNFTAARGGGAKTLTSGNLNIPGQVVLWQNPQSVDTLTVLCLSQDGMSITYYMTPAEVTAQQATTGVMGFEETTSTPGTTSPYGGEVLNNALFRPTDKALLKSSAQNYNISHKMLTDKIDNMWWGLRTKEWIMSAQLNNRLCYLVNNPHGEILAEGCKGNELWVYDITSEQGFWSRFLIQGSALRVFSIGGREFLGVTRPEGLFYLDPDARLDDYVVTDPLDADYLKVRQRPIPWRFETNTQGANRAHDAWAHLQHVQVTLGNFSGTMEYGVRGQDVNYKQVNAIKRVTDNRQMPEDGTRWDIDDILLVRRDMKEWFFYAQSVDGVPSWGEVGYVQYRYTPVSVNVGYEFGSVETFEYVGNTIAGPTVYADNGIPVPVIDFSRP